MENVNCSTCRYASFTVLKPKWNSLHYPPNSTDLHHQLPTFLSTFYYDLAKLINRLIEPTLKSTAKQSNIIENVCSLSLSTQNSSNSTSTIANDNQLQSVSTANVFGRLGDWKTYYVHRKASSYKWYLQFAVQIVRVRYLNRTATRRRVQEWNDGATLGKLYQTSHLQDDDEDERAVQDDDSSGSQKLTMFVVVVSVTWPPLCWPAPISTQLNN